MRLTIMGKNNCPYCDLAKRHLDEHKIPYEYVKVDENMEAYEKFRELGVRSVPQIMQEGQSVIEGGWEGVKITPIHLFQLLVGGQ